MINDMRDSISTWPIRIILILIILSFVSFYGWGRTETLKNGDIAVVNGDSISARDFAFQYSNVVQSYQKQGKLPQDIPENLQGMIKQQILTSLIYEKLKAFEAKKMGLSASDQKVKDIIKKQFSSAEGQFDFKFYEGFLRNELGKTAAQYEDEMRENIRAELFEQLVLDTGLTSDLELKESYKRNTEKVALNFIHLNPKNTENARPKSSKPTQEVLSKFYTDHSDQFRVQEKRKLDIAFFDKKTFKGGSDFSNEAEKLLHDFSSKYPDMKDATAKDPRLQRVETGFISYDDNVAQLSSVELTEVLNSTLTLEAGKSTVLVSRDGNKVFLTKLIEVQASKLPELASIHEKVEKAYMDDQNASTFETWIQSTWADVTQGKTTLDALAKKSGSSVKSTEPFSYSASNAVPEIGVNEDVMSESFKLNEKAYFAKPVKVGDDYYLLQIKTKIEPDWKKFEADHDTLAEASFQQSAESRFTSWMQQTEKNSKIKRQMKATSNNEPIEE